MKKVLITGATSGIGKQLARDYADANYQVIACGRNEKVLNQLNTHTNIQSLSFDVTNRDETILVLSQLSNIDIVILNAGNCEYIQDALHFDSVLFERMIKVNLLSISYCLEALIPNLKLGSKVCLMSSSVVYLPLAGAEAYGASKAAATYLGNTLSVSLAKYNIDVCVIHPGFVDTPLTRKNTFDMPLSVTVVEASQYIRKGIDKKVWRANT